MEQSKETELWDVKKVAGAFMYAIRTLRRMPPVKVQGYFNTWPDILYSEIEVLQQDIKPVKYRPSASAISEMEKTLVWITWVEDPEMRKLIWARAQGTPWKIICREFGYGRTRAWQIWRDALEQIADRLNNQDMKYEEKPAERIPKPKVRENCGYSDVIEIDPKYKPSGRSKEEIFESLVRNIKKDRDISEEQARMEANNLVRFGQRVLEIGANIVRRERAEKDKNKT